MPRFAANLSFLYTEHEFLDRFAAARKGGFAGVEFHFPYAHDKQRLANIARAQGLEVVLFNLPAGDWDAGERGIACNPDRSGEFREGVDLAIEHAQVLGCGRVNCLAGIRPERVSEEEARNTLIGNLRYAAEALGKAGIRLMIEPINTRDMPGFFISRTRQALDIIAAANCGNLFVQYDIYHAQVMEGDLARTLGESLASIGHVQIADNPGRHEPGTGEINFPFLFAHLDRIGYAGWVGCEYKPAAATEDSLGWLAPWLDG
jgi:hydroxypyruvate isomerase